MDGRMYDLVIFKRFPELRGRIPWISLGLQPTPIEQLKGFGYENLWIKRDDLSSPLYGGNKIRKLEFVLGQVQQQRKKRVVTFGGIGTNHGLATAIFCRELGLDCVVTLYDQPVTPNVKKNLQLLHEYNAEIIYKQTFFKTVLDYFVKQRISHPFSYFLHPGGSSTLGTAGFVNAAFELKEQVDNGLMPEPAYIFCPVGSNGTMAGLLLGCLLAGLKTTVVGVRVSISRFGPFDVCTPKAVQKLARKTYAYLKKLSDNLPTLTIPFPVLLDDYVGAGYGHPTSKGGDAYYLMKAKKGLSLDPCYSSKTFAAVLDHCKSNKDSGRPVLFWNTYNSAELAEPTGSSHCREMSPKIRAFLDTEEMVLYPPHDTKTERTEEPRNERL